MKIFILAIFYGIVIIFAAIFLTTFVEYKEASKIQNKFYIFGDKDNPTKFNYLGNEVEIYKSTNYLFDAVKGYNSNLYIRTLYINNIPVISVSCFDRTFHKSMSWDFNGEYSYKEVMSIIRYAEKEHDKKLKTKNKRIFD